MEWMAVGFGRMDGMEERMDKYRGSIDVWTNEWME
jgi:hypothetical protein